MKGKIRLGDLLVEKNIVTKKDIETALVYLKEHGGKLGQALVAVNAIDEEKLLAALRHHLQIPSVELKNKSLTEEIVKMLPGDVARKFVAIPLKMDESTGKKTLYVAMSNPLDLSGLEEIEFVTGVNIKPVLCKESEIVSTVERYYGKTEDGEVADDLSSRVGSKNKENEEDWVKKMYSAASEDESAERKNLDDSYYSSLKKERIVVRALVNLLVRYDIFSIEEIEEELKKVEVEFDV